MLPRFIKKPTFLLLSRPSRSILHAKQVELAPVHRELRKIRLFYQDAKSTDQQKQISKIVSIFGNSFPKRFIFYRYMDIPSVAHTMYAVAEARIPV